MYKVQVFACVQVLQTVNGVLRGAHNLEKSVLDSRGMEECCTNKQTDPTRDEWKRLKQWCYLLFQDSDHIGWSHKM